MKIEKRIFKNRAFKVNKSEDGPGTLEGRGIVFDEWSKPVVFTDWDGRLVTILEKIEAKAIEDVDLSDVLSYYNHVPPILGRTSAKTLELDVSTEAVDYRINLPDTTAGKDLAVSAERGDLGGSSFQFRVAKGGDKREIEEDDKTVTVKRTISKFDMVREMGPVDDPAYNNTDNIVKRDYEEFLKEQKKPEIKPDTKVKLKLRFRKTKLNNSKKHG